MSIQSLNEILSKQLNGTVPVSREQVREWQQLYPYFSLPLMLYLRQSGDRDETSLSRSMIYAGDIDEWAVQLGVMGNYKNFYPDTDLCTESTEDAIELFLHTYAQEETMPEELSDILPPVNTQSGRPTRSEGLYTIPAYDYTGELEAMPDAEDAQPMEEDDLLEKFIRADAAGEQLFSKPEFTQSHSPAPIPQSSQPESEALFSESLAKIYIQQRRYAKALEIIRKLSLNNPEKNVYFADQIRFLEKLIINVKN